MAFSPAPPIPGIFMRRLLDQVQTSAWLGLRGRFVSTIPPRRTTLRALPFKPEDFPLPDRERNRTDALVQGKFIIQNLEVQLGWPPQWASVKDSSIPESWRHAFHSHEFLRELLLASDRERARHCLWQLIQKWIEYHPEPSAANTSVAWSPTTTAMRLLVWFELFYASPPPEGMVREVVLSCVRQTRWLQKRVRYAGNDMGRCIEAIALATASVFFEGPWAKEILEQTAPLLERSLFDVIGVDGELHSRSPGQLLALSKRYLLLSQWLRHVDRERAEQMLQWSRTLETTGGLLRHPDGQPPLFNDTTLDGLLPQPPVKAPSMWVNSTFVHRGKNLFVAFDGGLPPANTWQRSGHAGPLNFELSWQKKRVFVDSGLCSFQGERHNAHRLESAHNVFAPGDKSSGSFTKIAYRPHGRAFARRLLRLPEGVWFGASHNCFAAKGLANVTRAWFVHYATETIFSVHIGMGKSRRREMVEWLHLAPGIGAQALDPHCFGLEMSSPLVLYVAGTATGGDSPTLRMVSGQTSALLHLELPTAAIEIKTSSHPPILSAWSLTPGTKPAPFTVNLTGGILQINANISGQTCLFSIPIVG